MRRLFHRYSYQILAGLIVMLIAIGGISLSRQLPATSTPTVTTVPAPLPTHFPTLPPTPTRPPALNLGLVLPNRTDPYFATLLDAAQKAADSNKATLLVAEVGSNPQLLTAAANSLLNQQVTALLVYLPDEPATPPALPPMNLPVITLGAALKQDAALQVGGDETAGIQQAVTMLCTAVRRRGTIVELADPLDLRTPSRSAALLQAVQAACPKVKVVTPGLTQVTRLEAKTALLKLLQEQPFEIAAVFAYNETLLLGAADASVEAGLPNLFMTGFGNSQEAEELVRSDHLSGLLETPPAEIGRLAVENAVRLLQGKGVSSPVAIPMQVFYSDISYGMPPNPASPARTVGVVLPNLEAPFNDRLYGGLTIPARAVDGVRLLAVDGKNDPQRVAAFIDALVAEKVDALLVVPPPPDAAGNDPQAFVAALQKVNQAKIPLFAVGSIPRAAQVVSYIATDPHMVGYQAAKYLCQAINSKGSVAEIQGAKDLPFTASLSSGLVDGMKANCPQVRLVSGLQATTRAESHQALAALLKEQPGLAGVFAHNDEASLGAVQAIQDAGGSKIKITGYGGGEEARQALKTGQLSALLVPYPREMGQIAMETVLEYLYGKKVDSNKPFPVELLTAP